MMRTVAHQARLVQHRAFRLLQINDSNGLFQQFQTMSDREQQLKQVLYISRAKPTGAKLDPDPILEQSRHNNALDGITGLLYSGDGCYLQVLEGPSDSVDAAFIRIVRDERHHDIKVVEERAIAAREFGYWSMASRDPGNPRDEFDARMEHMLRNASQNVQRAFVDLVTGRTAV